ncbi:MAG: hypothetical protein FJZ01_24850 [Candidatus Sericytochromatia bacterium]|nr:hypothetical protein [Candidatus Tanganyikabacteria bacterium]
MKRSKLTAALLLPVLITGLLAACSPSKSARSERYTSASVEGAEDKINLEAVHQAFFETAGKSFAEWMPNFEKRVNEIYQGDDVVSIDATKSDSGMVKVAGYLDKDGQQGLGWGDEKLFELEQTSPPDDKGFKYNMTGHGGQPYYAGYPPAGYHHGGILSNPFVQMFVLSQLLRPNFSYYTPPGQTTVLRDYRHSYRQTPRYRAQTTQNRGFFGKLFSKDGDRVRSSKGFGSGQDAWGGQSRKRSWFGSSGGNDSRWSGRRRGGSSWGSSSGWGSGRSSWGGRRSGGFGGRSWGGRRR